MPGLHGSCTIDECLCRAGEATSFRTIIGRGERLGAAGRLPLTSVANSLGARAHAHIAGPAAILLRCRSAQLHSIPGVAGHRMCTLPASCVAEPGSRFMADCQPVEAAAWAGTRPGSKYRKFFSTGLSLLRTRLWM